MVRRTTEATVDWEAEIASCGLSSLLDNDPIDDHLYKLAERALNRTRATVAKDSPEAYEACMQLEAPW